MSERRIGFIGTGIMGAPLVGHLLRGGCRVTVHSRTRAKAEPLLVQGATWADTPAGAAAEIDVLFVMVTDTPDVEQVLFGENGAAAVLPRGTVVVDLSTISPSGTRSIAARLAEQGVDFLDAPVTGGDVGARNATLTILVGGRAEAFDRVRPLLEQLGRRIVHVGPSGAGQALKACNQVLCAVNLMGVCEALLLARSAGIAPEVLIDALSAGAGGSWALANYGPRMAAGDMAPGFMVKLQQKDLRIVQEAGQAAGVVMPATALAQQMFRSVEARPGGGELGTQAMITAYRHLCGNGDEQPTRPSHRT